MLSPRDNPANDANTPQSHEETIQTTIPMCHSLAPRQFSTWHVISLMNLAKHCYWQLFVLTTTRKKVTETFLKCRNLITWAPANLSWLKTQQKITN